jgi:hypothetical protein
MTDESALFVLVRLPPPGPTRETLLRDYEAIAYGGSEEMLRKFFACEEVERELDDQQAQTAEAANRVADIGAHLLDQIEELSEQKQAQVRLDARRRADKARRDAEAAARAEAAQIRDYLETHPEPGASTDDTHRPTGELHAVEPVDQEHLNPETEIDAGGVPLSYGEPGIGGASYPEPNPADLGKAKDPKQVSQPTAVSFW